MYLYDLYQAIAPFILSLTLCCINADIVDNVKTKTTCHIWELQPLWLQQQQQQHQKLIHPYSHLQHQQPKLLSNSYCIHPSYVNRDYDTCLASDTLHATHTSPFVNPSCLFFLSRSTTPPSPSIVFDVHLNKKPEAIIVTKPYLPPQLGINLNTTRPILPDPTKTNFASATAQPPVSKATRLPTPTPPKHPPSKITSSIPSKNLRDRFNFASVDCAATIRSVSHETKGASSILNDNKDSYLLTPCFPSTSSSTNSTIRHVVIELCNDILIDTLILSNLELFSSTFKNVLVQVNSVYPETQDKPWRQLAELFASNIRSPQAFLINHSVTWTKYIRFEFLDQFGAQYFCPISNIKVYGTTMIEQYKQDTTSNSPNDAAENESFMVRLPLSLPRPPFSILRNRIPSPNLPSSEKPMLRLPANSNPLSNPFVNSSSTIDMLIPTSTPYGSYVPFLPPKLHVMGDESVPVHSAQKQINPTTTSTAPVEETKFKSVTFIDTLHPIATPTSPSTTHRLFLNNDVSTSVAMLDAINGAPLDNVSDAAPVPNALNSNIKHPIPVGAPTKTRANDDIASDSTTQPEETMTPSLGEEEGIYKVIMKRFATIEANYKLLVQYMDDYATGINHVIRTNDELQNKYFSQAMSHLSQNVASRMTSIRDELSQESEQLIFQVRDYEETTYEILSQALHQVGNLEAELASQKRWWILHLILFVLVVIGPWCKSLFVTILQVSLAMPAAGMASSPLRAKSPQFDHPKDGTINFRGSETINSFTPRRTKVSSRPNSRVMNSKFTGKLGSGLFRPSPRLSSSLNIPTGRQYHKHTSPKHFFRSRQLPRTKSSRSSVITPIRIPTHRKRELIQVAQPRPQTAPGVLVHHWSDPLATTSTAVTGCVSPHEDLQAQYHGLQLINCSHRMSVEAEIYPSQSAMHSPICDRVIGDEYSQLLVQNKSQPKDPSCELHIAIHASSGSGSSSDTEDEEEEVVVVAKRDTGVTSSFHDDMLKHPNLLPINQEAAGFRH